MSKATFSTVLCLFLAVCGILPAGQEPATQPVQPAPAGADKTDAAKMDADKVADAKSAAVGAPVDPNAYIIGPEDVLSILVWREPANSCGACVVRPDGKISLPLVGELQAAGTTPIQLGTSVAKALQRVMMHPEVTVSVERVNSRKYQIQGGVNKPGSFPLVVPTRVLDALGNAGGFRDFANTKKITVLRGTQTFKFNYNEVRKGKNMEQNILLEPGDHIFVPD